MARTGQAENSAANKEYQGEQKQAFATGQNDVGEFNQNLDTLRRGGQVAANPWLNAGYLANVNKLQGNALDAEQNSATDAIQQDNHRTGGLNSGATIGATKGLALDKMRMASGMSAGREAEDFGKNVQYQSAMAEAPLAGAQAEAPYFGGAVSGRSGALRNLTDLGIAGYGPWEAAIKAAGQAAAAGIQGAMKPSGGGNN